MKAMPLRLLADQATDPRFSLQVHGVGGASLFGTFKTSGAGVAFYEFLPAPTGIETRPDWAVGMLFGSCGLIGMYAGARMQKYIPQRTLKPGLAIALALLDVA